jgi:hypothetical protein
MVFSNRARVGVAVLLVGGTLGGVLLSVDRSEPAGEVVTEGASASGGDTTSVHGEAFPEADPVLQRTTADGTRISLVSIRYPNSHRPFPDGEWTPPVHCFPIGDLEVGLVGESHVAMGYAAMYGQDDREDAHVRGGGLAGHVTVEPFAYAVLQVGPEVEDVRLVLEGEVVDEAVPEHGWAVVAAALPPRAQESDLAPPDAEVEVRTADGTSTLPASAPSESGGPECQPPPPSLPPEATPADEATTAAVTETYRRTFAGGGEGDPARVEHDELLDDDFRARVRELGAGYGDITVDVDSVGVLEDGRALLVFRLRNLIGWQLGDAVQVDGEWRVGAQTYCQLLGMSGIECPAGMWRPGADVYQR